MRGAVAFLALFLCASGGVAREGESANLVGTWFGGTWSMGDSRLTFRANHTFDGIDGDAIMAGKWKLHAGRKLELIYYFDYDRKIISRSSVRHWAVIDSLTPTRLQFRWFDEELSPGFQLSSPRVWTKER